MPRHTFFSFSYEDVKNFKVNVVRKSGLFKNSPEAFIDGSIWETEKSKGAAVIKALIESGLNQTSVTAVLIGDDTADRRWVKYEIVKSFEKGNGILGIHLNRIRDNKQAITSRGTNPLERLAFQISEDGRKIRFLELVNRKWRVFEDLPEINNKKTNTLYFQNSFCEKVNLGKTFVFRISLIPTAGFLTRGTTTFLPGQIRQQYKQADSYRLFMH
ncbi:TIR domain-containing protein [Terrimonas rubra]|uniref:TIR domain-containing protein n=1 Tax=Terrimonas rubra TaxID=1035890 RepID=A0ABW5ZYJ8_9BACT